MNCDKSEACVFYRTYRYLADSKQYRLLVESYCEGSLQPKCRRIQYETDFHKEAPAQLAPNGYLLGTHKKLKTDNTRQFKRYKIKNGTCLLEVIGTKKTLSAEVIDVSEGGMCLELSVLPEELDIRSEKSRLKILGYSIDNAPLPLTKEFAQIVWQNKYVIGCCFIAPLVQL